MCTLALLAAVLLLLIAAVCWLPPPKVRQAPLPASFVVTDAGGNTLYRVLATDGNDCRPVARVTPDSWIAQAVVAAEDKRFWRHHGVDPLAVGRAIWQNAAGRRRVSGASTISTLVMRLTSPQGKRTLGVKAREYFQALQVERHLTKEEILTEYLNRAPFGGNVVGIEAASRRYFDKEWHTLSLAEAALLAGVPQSPSRLRPDRHAARAVRRREYVLDRMLALGMISEEEFTAARNMPVACSREAIEINAPHAVFAALQEYATSLASLRGDELVTTLDPALQIVVEESLSAYTKELAGGRIRGGAIMVLRVEDGAVVALAGSPDYANVAHAGQVNGAMAKRSPGSALKPFLYAAVFDGGVLTPGMVVQDQVEAFGATLPANFDGQFRGAVTAAEALRLSLNIPAYRLARIYGVARFAQILRDVGLGTVTAETDHYGLALALGGCEVRLWDMVGAYATLAGAGRRITPHLLADVTGRGKGIGRPEEKCVLSPEACWMVSDILGRRLESGNENDWVASKTGTSSGFRDAWCFAWNTHVVVGVWLGNPDGRGDPALVGATAAMPLALEIFRQATGRLGGGWPTPPPGVEMQELCASSGNMATERCLARVRDWRIRGVTRRQMCRQCEPAGKESEGNDGAGPDGARTARAPKIIRPLPGSIIHYTERLIGAETVVPLEASAEGGGTLFWFVNDKPVGSAAPGTTVLWRPQGEKGKMVATCADELANSAQVTFRLE